MKSLKRFFLLIFTSCIIILMTGCVYSKNKDWNDLNQEEREEVRRVLDEVKEELEDTFSNVEVTEDFVLDILDRIEQIIDEK